MAEITSVTSETLQAKVRELLPSQRGFGEDLQAQNVIVPVVDLTAAAEGTTTPISMQQALAFGSQSAFYISNASTTIVNTPGFYRITGVANLQNNNASNQTATFNLTDSLSTKTIWQLIGFTNATALSYQMSFDFIVFLAAGESLVGVANSTIVVLAGSSRQIANVNGELTNPSGFSPQ